MCYINLRLGLLAYLLLFVIQLAVLTDYKISSHALRLWKPEPK